MTTRPFDQDTHCTLFEVVHNDAKERSKRWNHVGSWMTGANATVPVDLPSWITREPCDKDDDGSKWRVGIHIVHKTEEERRERWDEAVGWMVDGKVPIDLPPWAQVRVNGALLNHGGNGGP